MRMVLIALGLAGGVALGFALVPRLAAPAAPETVALSLAPDSPPPEDPGPKSADEPRKNPTPSPAGPTRPSARVTRRDPHGSTAGPPAVTRRRTDPPTSRVDADLRAIHLRITEAFEEEARLYELVRDEASLETAKPQFIANAKRLFGWLKEHPHPRFDVHWVTSDQMDPDVSARYKGALDRRHRGMRAAIQRVPDTQQFLIRVFEPLMLRLANELPRSPAPAGPDQPRRPPQR